ncbi:hypothetical protein LCGC14_3056390, partial [marine sediment metagenome]
RPMMPYTAGLLRSVPRVEFSSGRRPVMETIGGNVPDPLILPPGCAFHPRCPLAEEICRHVQVSYGPQIGVVLEPEWLSAARRKKMTGPHIHFQLKKPIRWTTLI